MSVQRKLVFFGAISVDGYLARKNDALDWLMGTEGEEEVGFAAFEATVDTVIMGRKTYDQILVHSQGEFPYQGKKRYVFSRAMAGSNNFVDFINEDIVTFTKSLKEQGGKHIWVVGGGEVLRPLLRERLVDEFFIQMAPSIIGSGIPLFLPGEYENQLRLLEVKQYKQLAELHYELK